MTESFDDFLAWLGSDREQAAHNYENIRRKLMSFFSVRGQDNHEALADETINHVIQNFNETVASCDPATYFLSVARKILSEHLRK